MWIGRGSAQRYLNAALRNRDLGTLVEPARTSLNTYLDRWLDDAAKPRVRTRTFEDYSWLLKAYVRPFLGDRRLDSITPLDLQALYKGMQERGLTGRTVHVTHNVVRSALKQTVRWRLLPMSPANDVDLPRWEKREMRALGAGEASRFVKAARRDPQGLTFVLTLIGGLRPTEVLALRWDDCDFSRGTVRVQHNLLRPKNGGWILEDPKTSKSRRTIPLPSSLVEWLKIHRKAQAAARLLSKRVYRDRGFVFATAVGEPLDRRNLGRRNLKEIVKAAELPTIRWYDLRHTCASLLIEAGENPKVVAERLGHATVQMTLDTYSHVSEGMQKKASRTLEQVINPAALP